jgi:acyl-coenzyme A thioesterase PaaI-like protein
MCLVCGAENPLGLHARFYELAARDRYAGDLGAGDEASPATGPELLGVFTPLEEHQSYPGRLHGGISSAILDETIGRAILLLNPDEWGVTAEFSVRYRKPVPLDEEIRCLARITRDTSRLFEGTGEIVLADGTPAVTARGKYLKMPLEAIAEGGMAESEWFADPREAPDAVDL